MITYTFNSWSRNFNIDHSYSIVGFYCRQAMPYRSQDQVALQKHVHCVEDQEFLRRQLSAANLVAFVRDGAVLPRISGADDRPMDMSNVTLFKSPDSLTVEFDLPHAGK